MEDILVCIFFLKSTLRPLNAEPTYLPPLSLSKYYTIPLKPPPSRGGDGQNEVRRSSPPPKYCRLTLESYVGMYGKKHLGWPPINLNLDLVPPDPLYTSR